MVSYKDVDGQSEIGFIEVDEIVSNQYQLQSLLVKKTKEKYGENIEFDSIISEGEGID